MAELSSTLVSEIEGLVQISRKGFESGKSIPLEYRKSQLVALSKCLTENKEQWSEGLRRDLGMDLLIQSCEVDLTLKECRNALDNLNKWAAPEPRSLPVHQLPASGYVMTEPLGVVLVIGAWNYPISLLLKPLIGVIAAGNAAVLKPSEVAVHTAINMAKLLPKYLDPQLYTVVSGGVDQATELLKYRYDHIMYTGNGRVGKIIAKAAAEYLTPVTLELGGKSPVIVDDTINLNTACSRIVWGKFTNAGQTCVAPDYIFVKRNVYQEFLKQIVVTIEQFYGRDPAHSPDYARIVTENHLKRVAALLEGETVAYGGIFNEKERYISPTIVINASENSKILQEEIFGPVLPVMAYDDVDDVISFIKARPKPLALYIFSTNKRFTDVILKSTSSGGVGINEVVTHVACTDLPFGGVGDSGNGRYNGKTSFDTFSHHRSVLHRGRLPDPSIRFPPYNKQKIDLISMLSNIGTPSWSDLLLPVALVVAVTYRKSIARAIGW